MPRGVVVHVLASFTSTLVYHVRLFLSDASLDFLSTVIDKERDNHTFLNGAAAPQCDAA